MFILRSMTRSTAVVLATAVLSLFACNGDDGDIPADGTDDGAGSSEGGSTSAGSTGGESTDGGSSGSVDTTTSADSGSGSESTGEPPPFDGDLECLDTPFEAALDPVTVTGKVLGPISELEATIEVLSVEDDSVIDSMTTGTDGAYELTVPTGGMPTAVYFHITAPGHVETFRYFGYPLTADAQSGQRVWSELEAGAYADAGGITPEAGTGVLRVAPRDCDLALTGAGTTVSTEPAAPTIAYEAAADCDAPDPALGAATECGFAMAYDVPPGAVVVDAAISDVPFEVQTVRVEADAMTWVTLQPRRE